MSLKILRMYGILIAGLALVGFFTTGHLLGLMNVDVIFDIWRAILAAALLYVGFVVKERHAVSNALLVVGVLYIGIGIAGILAPTLGGLLPSGLTGFDAAFHLITGGIATFIGSHSGEHIAART
jgi:hypothetical protein